MKTFMRAAALILALAMTAALAGCGAGGKNPPEVQEGPKEEVKDEEKGEVAMDISAAVNTGFGELGDQFAACVESAGLAGENYMISPTSLKAALALAIAGAEGDTKAQLLAAAGFADEAEMAEWYRGVAQSIELFAEDLDRQKAMFDRNKEWMGPDAKGPDGAFRIANSFWKNSDYEGELLESYRRRIESELGAGAYEASPGEITDKVNAWANEQTNGMIPSIASDLSKSTAVLVNALYLRSSWIHEFSTYATEPGGFSCIDGSKAEKDFMSLRKDLAYYEDEETQLVVLPMRGGVSMVFAIGSREGLAEKIAAAEYTDVSVRIPKFEVESAFESGEIPALLKLRGAVLPFDCNGAADFSAMIEGGDMWYISDIIQKSKIEIDENGVEAAAVTAIPMAGATAMQPKEPKEFNADRPFSFAIVTEAETPERLFLGQIVK